jgi:hypothetical protein
MELRVKDGKGGKAKLIKYLGDLTLIRQLKGYSLI